MKKFFKNNFLPLIILFSGSIFLAFNLFKPGLPQSHDAIHHVIRIREMIKTLQLGRFPARWGFSLDNGYGVPVFNYIYPAPYYLSTVFGLAGLSLVSIYNFLLFTPYILGIVGVYLLFHEEDKFLATASALLYAMIPYQFINIFVRGAVGELFVLTLAPWALYFTKKLEKTKNYIIPLSFTLFLIFISHNFLSFIFLGFLFAYVFLFLQNTKNFFRSLTIALGLSSFFLIPMILERGYLLSISQNNFSYNYYNHFVYPKQLLYSKWGFGYSKPGYADNLSFQLGIATILTLTISALSVFITKRKKKLIFFLFLFLFSTFLTTSYSKPIWQLLSPLQIIQFPWRFLAATTFITPLLFFTSLKILKQKKKTLSTIITVLILSIGFYNVRNYRRPKKHLTQQEFGTEFNTYHNNTTTSERGEIVPRWTEKERYMEDNRWKTKSINIFTGNTEIGLVTEEPDKITIKANAENDRAIALINRNYFPSWKAYDEKGEKVSIKPSPDGAILLPLDQGVHQYTVKLEQTRIEKVSNYISLFSFTYLAYLTFKLYVSKKNK